MQSFLQIGMAIGFRYALANTVLREKNADFENFVRISYAQEKLPEHYSTLVKHIAYCVYESALTHPGKARRIATALGKQNKESPYYHNMIDVLNCAANDIEEHIHVIADNIARRNTDDLLAMDAIMSTFYGQDNYQINDRENDLQENDLKKHKYELSVYKDFLKGWRVPMQLDKHFYQVYDLAKQMDQRLQP